MVLSERQTAAIAAILSTGASHAANSLVALVRDQVTVSLPSIVLLPVGEVSRWIRANSPHSVPMATLRFRGPIHGTLALLFPVQSANRLTVALGIEPTAAGIGETIEETANILLNSVAGSMANCLGFDLDFDPPQYSDGLGGDCWMDRLVIEPGLDRHILMARTCFQLAESTIEGQILLHLDATSTRVLTLSVDSAQFPHVA